jgi:hypothetical protein
MPDLKRESAALASGPERGLYAGMATVDPDRRGPCVASIRTKPEYRNVNNKTVEVGADKTYNLQVVLVARIEIACLSPFL